MFLRDSLIPLRGPGLSCWPRGPLTLVVLLLFILLFLLLEFILGPLLLRKLLGKHFLLIKLGRALKANILATIAPFITYLKSSINFSIFVLSNPVTSSIFCKNSSYPLTAESIKLVNIPTILAKIWTPFPIISNVFSIAINDFSRPKILKRIPPAINRRKLVIEEKIFPTNLGGFIRLPSLSFPSLFSIFFSLASIFSFCFSLLFIVKEEIPLLNFAVIKSLIPTSISLVEDFSDASGGFSSFLR